LLNLLKFYDVLIKRFITITKKSCFKRAGFFYATKLTFIQHQFLQNIYAS